jgi:hypothetical protein
VETLEENLPFQVHSVETPRHIKTSAELGLWGGGGGSWAKKGVLYLHISRPILVLEVYQKS